MTEIDLHGQSLFLLPEGAAYDAERRALFVSDLHLGKTAVFRDAGLPLPDGPDATMLNRLAQLVKRTEASTLVILGDVFHARSPGLALAVREVARWREAHADLRWQIVPGNHDRRIPWNDWLPNAEVLDEDQAAHGPWRLAHFPPETAGDLTLCGHLHPGIAIGAARQRKLRLPCFWWRNRALVLPAFGDFTGLAMIERVPEDRVWVAVNDRVTEVPSR